MEGCTAGESLGPQVGRIDGADFSRPERLRFWKKNFKERELSGEMECAKIRNEFREPGGNSPHQLESVVDMLEHNDIQGSEQLPADVAITRPPRCAWSHRLSSAFVTRVRGTGLPPVRRFWRWFRVESSRGR